MPVPPRKRYLGPEQRLALQLLAGIPFGTTETAMFVNGFARQTLVRYSIYFRFMDFIVRFPRWVLS
jgi:hypothetical protein